MPFTDEVKTLSADNLEQRIAVVSPRVTGDDTQRHTEDASSRVKCCVRRTTKGQLAAMET